MIVKFRALRETPQGHAPGQIFEAEEDAGAILCLPETGPTAERVVDGPPAQKPKDPKGSYKRRDLAAEPAAS